MEGAPEGLLPPMCTQFFHHTKLRLRKVYNFIEKERAGETHAHAQDLEDTRRTESTKSYNLLFLLVRMTSSFNCNQG